jgi:paraquat-inducible protein B
MSQTVHHARVGAFVIVGLLSLFATAIYVGSVRLFSNEAEVLFYFGESVNGLSVGSPVKFNGVPIGKVSHIYISYDQDPNEETTYIPVFAKIDLGRVHRDLGVDQTLDLRDRDQFDTQVLNGLRARLEMESFITGQLYVEMGYFAPPGAPFHIVQRSGDYLEVPSVPSTLAELGASASSVMAELATLDVKGISDALRNTLETMESRLADLDTKAWNTNIVSMTDNLNELTEGLDVQPLLEELRETNATLSALMKKIDASADPLLIGFQGLVEDGREAVRSIDNLSANLGEFVGGVEPTVARLDGTLLEVREAARAMRELLDYLERNPRALLSGKEGK